MLGSPILDVAIGVVFVFLALSLVCSAMQELLEAAMKMRAKDLERGISELVGDPANQTKFIAAIYDHGLVNGLYRGKYASTPKRKLPSYIPSRNFALAVLDLVKAAPAAPAMVIPANVSSALHAFEETAKGDFLKYQLAVEDWYNSAMDRVSGWYKRRAQTLLFLFGLVVSIAVNADCVNIAKKLSTDSGVRQAVVAMAQAVGNQANSATDPKKPVDVIRDNINTLGALGLPIGWSGNPGDTAPLTARISYAVTQHWLGWLLTGLAISLGAPFWFDVLNKIVVVRSTVKPHEKSREEPSKDAA